jgi:hypothetical protein
VDNKKELRVLAEQIWDAKQNDTFASLKNKLRPNKLKVPQTREDLRQMTKTDLMQWIGSQRVCIRKSDNNKDRILALAETTWDTTENGTLDNLKKRRQSASNSVKVPNVRESFGRWL